MSRNWTIAGVFQPFKSNHSTIRKGCCLYQGKSQISNHRQIDLVTMPTLGMVIRSILFFAFSINGFLITGTHSGDYPGVR